MEKFLNCQQKIKWCYLFLPNGSWIHYIGKSKWIDIPSYFHLSTQFWRRNSLWWSITKIAITDTNRSCVRSWSLILSSKLIIKVLNYELQILGNHPLWKVYLPIWERLLHRIFPFQRRFEWTRSILSAKVYVCDSCFLVQVAEYKKTDEIFDKNYVYFSSYSSSWLEHAKNMYTTSINDLDILRIHLSLKLHRMMDIYFNISKNLKFQCWIGTNFQHRWSCSFQRNRKPGWIFGVSVAKKLVREKQTSWFYWLATMFSRMYGFTWFCGRIKNRAQNQTVSWQWNSHLFQLVKHHQFDTIYQEHFLYLSFMTVNAILDIMV